MPISAALFMIAGLASAETPAPPLPSVTLPAPRARVLTDYELAWGVGSIIGGFARARGEAEIGKFTLTLRRKAARWMIMSDMDNGNARRPSGNATSALPAAGNIVFVCEHGTVKSVMAAHWFNHLAAERKAPFRAISRGVSPDAAIPPPIAASLVKDGFDLAPFTPARLERADLEGAAHVVAIGVDSPLFAALKDVSRWNDIPPASTDYAASRDAMRARMGALLDSLARARGTGQRNP